MAETLQISISNDAWERHLLTSLRHLQLKESLCDTKLVTEDGQTCRAHGVMLAASSPVLLRMLEDRGPDITLHLQQVPQQKVMKHILDFIYEGQITIPIKLLLEVQKAADRLCIKQLSDVCLTFLGEMGINNNTKKQDNLKRPLSQPIQNNINTDASSIPTSCVLKVPSIKKPFEASSQIATALCDKDNDEAIDLSVVKSEDTHTSRNPSLIVLHQNTAEKTNVMLADPEPQRIKNIMQNGGFPPNASALQDADSHLKPNCDVITGLDDSKSGKLELISNNSHCDSSNEEDDLVEEMVAEQLLQSRMHRGMGKRPKGMKRFHCRICDSRFTRLDNLRVHIRSIHTGKKPYKCNLCDKTFTRAFTLKYHKMSHDGIKPWTCPDCGRGFTRKDYHQDHIRNQICKKNKSVIKSGSRTSSPVDDLRASPDARTSSPTDEAHQCQMCDAIFDTQDALEMHMESCMDAEMSRSESHHSGEDRDEYRDEYKEDYKNEYVCDICHTHFLDHDSLELHHWEHKRQEESLKFEMIAPDAPDKTPEKISRREEPPHNNHLTNKHTNPIPQNQRSNSIPPNPNSNPIPLNSLSIAIPPRPHSNPVPPRPHSNPAPPNPTRLPAFDLKNQKAKDHKTSLASSLKELLCDDENSNQFNANSKPHISHSLHNSLSVLDLRKSSFPSDENENLTSDLNLPVKKFNSNTFPMKDKLSTTCMNTQENFNIDLSFDENLKRRYSFSNMIKETDENSSMNILNSSFPPLSLDSQYSEPPKKRSKQDRPYTCDICQARFTRGDNMRVHRRRHFNATKMFSCVECGQAFTRASSLKHHMGAAHKHL